MYQAEDHIRELHLPERAAPLADPGATGSRLAGARDHLVHMAAVQALHKTMTLGQQNGKMYNVINHHSPSGQANCVIVSAGAGGLSAHQQSAAAKGKRPLAPAPERGSVLVANEMLRCKRKINFVPYGSPGHQPASVARRNARERNRVKQVNNGFATLRQHIPASVCAALAGPGAGPGPGPAVSAGPVSSGGGRGASKKLSKVETLRLAVEYIRSLQKMIEDHEAEHGSGSGDSGMLDARYYSSSPDSSITQLGHSMLLQTTATPCSEASAASPTPSYSSEGSVSASSSYNSNALYHSENYENYEPTSPEDEELLDAISWWQQQ